MFGTHEPEARPKGYSSADGYFNHDLDSQRIINEMQKALEHIQQANMFIGWYAGVGGVVPGSPVDQIYQIKKRTEDFLTDYKRRIAGTEDK